MFWLFLTIGIILFTFIAWRNLPVALAIFFTLLPTYLIRFHVGTLPTTVLEVMFGVIFLIWIIKNRRNLEIKKLKNYLLPISIGLFLLGATISIFTAVDLRSALGEWRAFYIEPVIMFLILITTIKTKKEINQILLGLVLCGFITSVLAIYQHFTGWLVPHSFWANRNTYRVTAWYGFPNGVGLFLAPIVPLAFYLLKSHYRKNKIITALAGTFILMAPVAIFYSKTTAAMIGLLAGLGLYLLLLKKTRAIALVGATIAVIGLILLPGSNPIKQEILAQDRSGQLRRDIWNETIQYLKVHPVRGAGMAAYSREIAPFRQEKNIEVFHHPHNIFLTIWVNTGLVGLIGFTGLLIWFYWTGARLRNSRHTLIAMTIILVMGLVDSPYIKNDLALLFWLVMALGYVEFTDKTDKVV